MACKHVPDCPRHTNGIGNIAVEILVVSASDWDAVFIHDQRPTAFGLRH
jgi:hypothetical protein